MKNLYIKLSYFIPDFTVTTSKSYYRYYKEVPVFVNDVDEIDFAVNEGEDYNIFWLTNLNEVRDTIKYCPYCGNKYCPENTFEIN